MAEKIILKVVAETKGASKDIDKVGKGANTAAKETTFLSAAMGGVTKAMNMIKATGKLMFGSIKAGIISTGIGILLIAFGALVSYFTNTKKGAEKLQIAFAVVGAAVDVIVDRISAVGSAVANFFSGNWGAAADDLASAFGGVGEEIMNEANATIRLQKEMQTLKDLERDFGVEKAKTSQAIANALLISDDETMSNEKRLESLKEALALEAKTTEKELSLQRRRVAAKEEEVALGESLEADLQALSAEKIKLIEMETRSIKIKRKVQTEVNAFEKQIAAEEKARSDARRARGKARRKQRETEAEQLLKLNNTIELLEITNADDRAKRALEIQRESELKSAESKKNSKEQILSIDKKYDLLEADRLQKIADKKKADDTKDEDIAEAKRDKEADKLAEYRQNNTLNAITDAQVRADAELKIAFDKEIALAELLENSEEVKAEIVKKYDKLKQKSSDATAAIEKQNQKDSVAAVGSAIGQAAALTEKGSKKWKALKTAEALIGTFLGAQRAYNSTVGIVPVGPILAPIMAGLAVASGMAQVRSIQNTELPKMNRGGIVGGYGSGTSDSVNAKLSKGEAVINARSASMFRGALSSMNLAGGGVGFAGEDEDSSGGGVIKAYVLSDEMTTKQARTEKINRRTSI
tara:strand:+ start:1572 stop:3488 length:1917 start_codon:yes stop_codon:yes gene_type:complete